MRTSARRRHEESTVDPERWQRVQDLFDQALELAPGEREKFLDEECEDPEIRHEVESLLAADAESDPRVDRPIFRPGPSRIPEGEVTRILDDWNRGDSQALERLIPQVYDDLRAIAGHLFKYENSAHTLQPTALVNDLYLRLVKCESVDWKNRKHFFGGAARMMRQLLVDHARKRKAGKRGGDVVKVPLHEGILHPDWSDPDVLIAGHEALEKLAKEYPRQAEVAELRLFGDFKNREIAEALDVSETTVKKDWKFAKAWLKRELQ